MSLNKSVVSLDLSLNEGDIEVYCNSLSDTSDPREASYISIGFVTTDYIHSRLENK